MVDDGRKVDHPDQVETVTTNPSLKLKINLRDRQSIRKRHRSSSPASSDSSSTHGSTRTRHLTGGPTRASSLKRNRKEVHQRRRADELGEEPDTPPPSNGSPAKRNEDVDVKKAEKPNGNATETVLQGNILLVDMNGDDEEAPKAETQQIPDPSGSPPESPVEEEAKSQVMEKLEAQVDAATCKIVKRLTRQELERLVMEQMCLAIRERGVTGELERKLEASDAQLERYRRRSEALHKQVSDLEMVVRRYVQQSKGRNQPVNPPIKMTRSVGLQINLASHPSIAVQVAGLKKAPMPEPKPAVTIAPAYTIKTISTSPQTAASATVVSPTGANNLARVPIPPSFTMQSPDIASYVPQQAVPRYRTVPQRRSDEGPAPTKIATYVNIGGVKSLPSSIVASKLQRNSVNITPVIPSGANQRPQGNANTVAAMLSRARAATAFDGGQPPPPPPASVPMARWSKVPASRATTVNKVTLPGRLPNVIDLTDEDLEKERAAAAAGRLIVPRPMPKQTSGLSNGFPSGGSRGGVALKSTTLNGRNPLTANKPPNIQPPSSSPMKSTLSHPAPLPATPVGASNPSWKAIAPKPSLDIKRVANGIVLSWNMQGNLSLHADISSYQLFAYQEGSDPPTANGSVWKRVGDVKALPLPMACTLTQFLEGHRYHFAVRAMDVHGRAGPYSEPGTIVLS